MDYMPSWQSFLPCFSRRVALAVAATSCARRVRCPQHGIARRHGTCVGDRQGSAGWGRAALHLSPRAAYDCAA
jgi:hypothetical protein